MSVSGSSMGSSNLHGSSGPGGMDGTSRGKTETAEYSILGVLYTLSKEKKRMSLRFAAMTILIDFLQLGAFCITLPYINHYFEWVELRGLFASAGWSMYQTVFWFWSAVLVFCIAICLYVCYCFRRDTFPYLWPIKILRNILGLFFSIFYVTSLNFFLISLDCEDKGGRQTLAVFSDQPCWEGKLLAMQVVAVILGICFFCISLLLAIAKFDTDASQLGPLGATDSTAEIRMFFMRNLITLMTRQMVIVQPHYFQITNQLRAGLYATLFASVLVQFIGHAFMGTSTSNSIGIITVSVAPVAFAVGWIASLYRMREPLNRHVLEQGANEAGNLEWRVQSEFRAPYEVEMLSRFVYQFNPDEEDAEKAEAYDKATAIFKAGVAQYPESAAVRLAFSNFLIHFRRDDQAGHAQVEEVRRISPSVQYRFMIFIRDMERLKKQRAQSFGQGTMDLVSYVEFQSQLRRAVRTHKKAFRGMRNFWRHLLSDNSMQGIDALGKMLRDLNSYETTAEKTYKGLLNKYPRSVRLLRSYGVFELEIKNEEDSARKFFTKADQLEDEQAVIAEEGEAMGNSMAFAGGDKDGFVVISKRGTIRNANKKACKMFGYKKEEMMGRNVAMLMPSPYKQQHNSYLERYERTRRGNVMNAKRIVEGLHKKGHTFTIQLAVTEVNGGTDPDNTYAAIIKEVDESELSASVSMTLDGTIVNCNQKFMDMFEYTRKELFGSNIKKIMPPEVASKHDGYLSSYRARGSDDVVGVEGRRLEGMTKSGLRIPLSITVDTAGEGDSRVLTGKITDLSNEFGIITIDLTGLIHSCNKTLTSIFGYSAPENLIGDNITKLMPLPYRHFHDGYLRAYKAGGEPRIVGKGEQEVTAVHADGTQFKITLTINEVVGQGGGERLFAGRVMLASASSTGRKEGSVNISDTGVIESVNQVALDMFRFDSEGEMVGNNIRMLMPGAVAAKHDDYLARYKREGGTNLVGAPNRQLFGVRATGDMFPLSLRVTEVVAGDHSIFKGTLFDLTSLEPLITIDQEGIIMEVNADATIFFGYSMDELMGNNISLLMPSEVAERHDDILARYKADRDSGSQRESRVLNRARPLDAQHRDGSKLPIILEATEVKMKDGRTGYVARILSKALREDYDFDAVALQMTEEDQTKRDELKEAAREREQRLAASNSKKKPKEKRKDKDRKRGERSDLGGDKERERDMGGGADSENSSWGMEDEHSWNGSDDAGSDGSGGSFEDDSAFSAGSSVGGGMGDNSLIGDSMSSVGGGRGKKRGRRIRLIRRLIRGSSIRAVFRSIKTIAYTVFALGLAVVIVDLSLIVNNSNSQHQWLGRIGDAGHAASEICDVTTFTMGYEDAKSKNPTLGTSVGEASAHLGSSVSRLKTLHEKLFLDHDAISDTLEKGYITSPVAVEEYYTTSPPRIQEAQQSLWELVLRVIENAGQVADAGQLGSTADVVREMRFVIDNHEEVLTAYDRIVMLELENVLSQASRLRLIQALTVGLQACVLSLLPILLFRGLTTIFRHRDLLFLVFLGVPKRVLKSMAEKRSEAQEDSDDSDSDASMESSDDEKQPKAMDSQDAALTAADESADDTAPGEIDPGLSVLMRGPMLQKAAVAATAPGVGEAAVAPIVGMPKTDSAAAPAMEKKGAPPLMPTTGGLGGGTLPPPDSKSLPAATPSDSIASRPVAAAVEEPGPKSREKSSRGKKGKSRGEWMQEQRLNHEARRSKAKKCHFLRAICCYFCLRHRRRVHPADHHIMRKVKIVYILYSCFSFILLLLGATETARHTMAVVSSEPLRDVHASAAMLYLSSRLRTDATALVMTQFSDKEASAFRASAPPTTAIGRETLRVRLTSHATRLKEIHGALLYGGSDLALEGSLDRSPVQEALYFASGCLRANTSSCYPRTHQFFRTTNSGLHTALRALEFEALMLANQTSSDLMANNTGFQFVRDVAANDVHDGLITSITYFVDESNEAIDSLILLATTTSICFMLAIITLYHWFFQPFLWRIQVESTRAAVMLSFLPTSIIISRMKLISKRMKHSSI